MENTIHYDFMVRKLRSFFQRKGYLEVPAAYRTSILAACEDPRTVTTYSLGGVKWPAPQTGQMWLEVELLKNPTWNGVYCIGPSYRDEPNPIPGRHVRLFPMFDFEGLGDFSTLQAIEAELLVFLGFQAPTNVDYEDMCTLYGATKLEHAQEQLMAQQISTSLSLEKFPLRTDPFWNMKHAGNGIFNKADVILHGMETIGSAERSCNKEEMRHYFYTISGGAYAQLFFDHFGRQRVMQELDEYLALPMIPRFGGGIGLMRLEAAMKKAGLFDESQQYIPATTAFTQPTA